MPAYLFPHNLFLVPRVLLKSVAYMSTSNVPDPADWIELVSQFSIFFPNTGKRKHHVSSRTWKRISMLESRCT